jgi:cation-transporting P-type ATPase E
MAKMADKPGDASTITGLSSAEVAERRAKGQYNKPPESAAKSLRQIFLDNIVSVFNVIIGLIIIFLLAFYVNTGDSRLLLDAVGVFTVALFNTTIAISQEIKAKVALDKVNMLLAREVAVLRDGVVSVIPQEQIVLDDVIAMRRGDQAVVDGTVLYSNHMEIDESLLTGESTPIEKEQEETILSGSFCLSGNGYYRVTQLSDTSYASKVTKIAQQLKVTVSPLQRQINRIVVWLFSAAVLLCAAEGTRSFLADQVDADFARRLATIMIGLVPQGLVLMASVTFAIGIYRISKVGALVQAFNAIESFANVQVICMDKTGTLTQNRMTVRKITPLTDTAAAESFERMLGTYAKFSSDKNATIRALESFEVESGCEVLYEVPFSSERKMSVLALKQADKECAYVLGAFDMLVERCTNEQRAMSIRATEVERLDVYRNLMFGRISNPEAIDRRHDQIERLRVEPLCVVSLSDTVREDVADVLKDFERRGIRFKILSGDSATSILATCRDIGWAVGDRDIIMGSEIDALTEEQISEAVVEKTVFARLRPEHKVTIVKALKSKRIYTAMIGDGVNDVPAIKQANLGMAMDEGASITKEVADIILLRNRFTLLPEVFEEGKKIINTVGSIARLFLTKNFMVIYLTLVSVLLAWEFPLTPRRVALINIFAIGLPAMIIALTNTNTTRHRRFILDLLSFVAVSALVVVASGYAGLFFVKNNSTAPDASEQVASMAMLSIMIVVSVASFLIVATIGGRRRLGLYFLYAASLVLLYFAVVKVEIDGGPLGVVKTFYEIYPLDRDGWTAVLAVCAASSVILVIAQKFRAFILDKAD